MHIRAKANILSTRSQFSPGVDHIIHISTMLISAEEKLHLLRRGATRVADLDRMLSVGKFNIKHRMTP